MGIPTGPERDNAKDTWMLLLTALVALFVILGVSAAMTWLVLRMGP